MVRKGRIARAVAHRERYLARLALSGWLLRTLLAADFAARLRLVAKQVSTARPPARPPRLLTHLHAYALSLSIPPLAIRFAVAMMAIAQLSEPT